MKMLKPLLNERFVRKAASFLQAACWLAICFFALVTVLACLGRQQFTLVTSTDVYEGAIYAERDQGWLSHSFTVTPVTVSALQPTAMTGSIWPRTSALR